MKNGQASRDLLFILNKIAKIDIIDIKDMIRDPISHNQATGCRFRELEAIRSAPLSCRTSVVMKPSVLSFRLLFKRVDGAGPREGLGRTLGFALRTTLNVR